MKAAWIACWLVLGGGICYAQSPPIAAPQCVVSGRWKGSRKSEVLTSADGHTKLYGQLQWDRPGKWTHQRCEAYWWVYASTDGGKFKPVMGRADYIHDGQSASLAVAGFSPGGQRAAADLMTTGGSTVAHGYGVVDLADHSSCFGSAVKGIDGVREELALGQAPWLERLMSVRDDGWLELSVHRGASATGAASEPESTAKPHLVFDPCSSKLRVERGQ